MYSKVGPISLTHTVRYVLILFIVDPYLGTWTRTREFPILVYVLRFPSMGRTKNPIFGVFTMNVLILISRVTIDAWLF